MTTSSLVIILYLRTLDVIFLRFVNYLQTLKLLNAVTESYDPWESRHIKYVNKHKSFQKMFRTEKNKNFCFKNTKNAKNAGADKKL